MYDRSKCRQTLTRCTEYRENGETSAFEIRDRIFKHCVSRSTLYVCMFERSQRFSCFKHISCDIYKEPYVHLSIIQKFEITRGSIGIP